MYEIRKQQILDLLNDRDHISVKEIKDRFQVSAMTVQRDLTKMEQEGLIIKGFGEISKVKGIYLERLMLSQEKDIPENQDKIANHAASFIEDGDTVFLSSGNIVFNLAKRIKQKQIIVVTPSIRAALALSKGKGSVYMSGGKLTNDGINLAGEYAEMTLRNFYADKAFITCASINARGEMCEYSENEVRIKRVIMEHAKQVYLLIEADKFGISKFYRSEDLSQVTDIITDRQLPDNYISMINKLGIKLHVLYANASGN